MGIMLRLGEDIGCDELGVCSLVCDDPDLRRTCRKVDLGMIAEEHLCCRHIDVAGPHNLLYRPDRLCAKCHRCDRLGTADTIAFCHPGDIHSNQRQRINRRRRAAADLRNPGNTCRNGRHQDR